jgi:hypothetical protein
MAGKAADNRDETRNKKREMLRRFDERSAEAEN